MQVKFNILNWNWPLIWPGENYIKYFLHGCPMKISRYCLRDFAPKGTSYVLAFWTQQAICLFLPEHSWKSSSSSLLKLSRSAPKNSALHLWAKNKIQPHHNGTGLISFRKVHDVVKLHTMKLQFTAKSVFTDLIANALVQLFLPWKTQIAWFTNVSLYMFPIFSFYHANI